MFQHSQNTLVTQQNPMITKRISQNETNPSVLPPLPSLAGPLKLVISKHKTTYELTNHGHELLTCPLCPHLEQLQTSRTGAWELDSTEALAIWPASLPKRYCSCPVE